MEIRNGVHTYKINKLVGQAQYYNLYLCHKDDGRECLLQIATTVSNNGTLERAAFILRELKVRADAIQKEYQLLNPGKFLNYDLGFPEVVDSFIYHDQGDRRINILAFRKVSEVGKMVPISNITEKNHRRIDLKTSGWIMGKVLKMLVMAHSEGMVAGLVNGKNILIEPDQHYIVIFDWSAATLYPETIPDDAGREEISQAAQAVIVALGGNAETFFIPNDDSVEGADEYVELLQKFASGGYVDAMLAHAEFYRFIKANWFGFYPFTTKPLPKD